MFSSYYGGSICFSLKSLISLSEETSYDVFYSEPEVFWRENLSLFYDLIMAFLRGKINLVKMQKILDRFCAFSAQI